MAEYIPPRYTDPNYLGFDDFEKQLLKRGIVESYYEKAYTEVAGEAYIKAANQQAFRYSEARRAVADALGAKHTIPAADTVIPQSAPGVVSSTGAKAIASAARSTGAQSARVLKTAATETVEQLARNPKTAAGALPLVGAVAAGVFETTGSRNAGRSWGDSVSRGIGGAVGGTIGGNLGGAGAAALTLNPVPAAAAAVGGAIAGERAGAAAGSVVWSGLTGRIPGTIPWALRKTLDRLPNLFGRDDRADDLSAYNPAGKQQSEDVTLIPPFTGGQMPGVLYRAVGEIQYTITNCDTGLTSSSTTGASTEFNLTGPISGLNITYDTPGLCGPRRIVWSFNTGTGISGTRVQLNPLNNRSVSGAKFVGSFERSGGLPDTGGDPSGGTPTTSPRPQAAARPNSPIYTPSPAQPGNTPPSSTPAPPDSPDDLEEEPKRLVPPIAPAGSPAPSPVPTSTPNPVTLAGSPSTVPNQSNGTNPANSGNASGATDTPDLDTNKDTDTIKIHNPEDSNQVFKIPGYPDLKPGETIEIEDTEGNRAISRAIYAALTGVVVGGGIIAAQKIANLNKTSTTPVDPPTPPPPQNPTDTGCRCNSPVLSKLDEFEKKLGLNNIVSGAGDASVMAYLQKMQAFAEKAWKATQMQKALDVLTFVGVMHNVSMLSRDVGETMGYVLSQALDIVGIDDEEGNALDVPSIVGNSVTNFLRGVLGDVWFEGIRDSYRKANRIVQSASMVIWTIRSIQDSSLDLMEWVAESTGKIGNALKRFGVVGERAYPWMSERAKAQHRMRNRFSKLTNTLENAEDVASSFAIGTSNVLEIQQETGELGENWQRFKESLNDAPDPWFSNSPVESQVTTETAASVSPNITATDAERSN